MSEAEIFSRHGGPVQEKLKHFEKYVERHRIARFLARYELFKKSLDVQGSIVECGVHEGGGIMAWAKMASTFEPFAFNRKIIGFDTFEGFPSVSEQDLSGGDHANGELRVGGWAAGEGTWAELNELIADYDRRRILNRFPKVTLVRGDARQTIPKYVEENKHLIVALLFLDFDLYEPTKVALETLLPRMPRGAVLAFDEVNHPDWPGETMAMLEGVAFRELRLQKFSFEPNISYAVL